MMLSVTLVLVLTLLTQSNAFSSTPKTTTFTSNTNTITNDDNTVENVNKLKKILTKEYTSFFNPMYKEYYQKDVTFLDPLTKLSGVSSYENNVNMLSGRTLLGSILFEDASISLHSVTGGEVIDDKISDVVTRWTLRLTAKILPWKPKA